MAAFLRLRVKSREQRQLGEELLGRAPVQRVAVNNRQHKWHPTLLPALQHHEKEVGIGMCDVILYATWFYCQKNVKCLRFPVHHRLP